VTVSRDREGMTELYFSYARADRARAAVLAEALESEGFKVWWDWAESPGELYAREAPEALKRADAVLALWSQDSLHRTWNLDEAAAARDAHKLINISLDGTLAPPGFSQLSTFDLAHWAGGTTDDVVQRLCAAARRAGGGTGFTPAALAVLPQRRNGWRLALGVTAAAAVLIGAAFFYNATRTPVTQPPLDADTNPPGMTQSYGLESDDLSAFGAHDLIRLALARSGFEQIEAGAAGGDALGLGLSCIAYALGEGAAPDAALARTRCEAAAAGGSSLGPLMLARLAEAGEAGLSPDAAQGFLEQAGDADDPRALTELARRALAQSPPDAAAALPPAQRAARMGHHPAQMLMGWIHETGAAGAVDFAQAYTWYDEAAQKAYPPALTASGRLLEAGQGTALDLDGARGRYEEAASRGDPEASFRLALMLDQGRGGPQDRERAQTLMRAAVAADYPGAAEALAQLEQQAP
jgi:TPR repeat protein